MAWDFGMTPVLTIAIPTRNRAKFLQKNLDGIIEQIEKLPRDIAEIFVSNNASTDGTDKILSEYASRYKFFRYVTQSKNLGANRNFYTVLKEACGEYVWLLGDDDAIVETCITSILSDIKKYNEPDIIIGGTENDNTHQRVYFPDIKTHIFNDKAVLKKYDLINLAGKMSVLIFKKTSLDHVLDAGWTSIYEMKTPWPHLVWFIEMLLNSGKILILPYSTNYIVSDSRYNLIQDGLVRLNILVVEYAALLIKILSGADEEIKLFSYQHIAQKRIGELLKILAYSTYLNGYGQTIKAAFEALKKMPLKANKVIFTGFYLFPSLLPIFFRKWLFKIPLILRPNWLAYKDFIRYLQEVSRLQKVEHQGRNFNPQDL